MDIWAEYEERMKQQERFRQLTIKEQLAELENKTDKSDCIIGEIHLQKQFFELNNRQENKNILSGLLGTMKCVKDYGVMGMGDVEYRWLFEKDNLLVGICGLSYRGGSILVGGNYKVYRFSKKSTANIDDVEKLLF